MKRMLGVALAIGVLVSTVFMAIPSMRDGTSDWADLELPGMIAAFFFWGTAGGPVFLGVAIAWAVNAVVYGLVALVVIGALKIISAAVRKVSSETPSV
jgi:O-antigen ligase